MSQLFTIQNDKILITKLALNELEGNVTHTGNLTVSDTLTVDTLNVKNLKTEGNNPVETGRWTANTEEEVTGKGFNWTFGTGSFNLIYKDGGRIWTDADFDLDNGKAYKIDNVPVLSSGTLGPTITKSNLRQIGSLNNLTVIGEAEIGQFAFFSSNLGRLGINTDQPNAAISIVENDVEFIAGSSNIGSADVGTYTNHHLNIVTDNIPRIVVKNTGEVVLNGDVKINGVLTVNTILSDTRIDRTSPLEFKATRDSAIYGKGLIWTGTGSTRQLIMMANPDRLWSSESLDLIAGQSYYIDGKAVVSSTALGDGVVTSNLSHVGNLESLTVLGPTRLQGSVIAEHSDLLLKNAVFNNGLNQVNISSSGLTSSSNLTVTVSGNEVFYSDSNEIVIGDKSNARKPVKIYGPISVGINNPDPGVDFSVKGNISFANRKFITSIMAPIQGTFSKGDVCWNDNPQTGNYVGWVCVADGTPGTWLPFGAIASS